MKSSLNLWLSNWSLGYRNLSRTLVGFISNCLIDLPLPSFRSKYWLKGYLELIKNLGSVLAVTVVISPKGFISIPFGLELVVLEGVGNVSKFSQGCFKCSVISLNGPVK